MNFSRPRNISIYTALIITIIFNITYGLIGTHTNIQYHSLLAVVASVVLFTFSFIVYQYFLKKFLYEKIKVIYKTIHLHKASKADKPEKINMKSDVISDVNQEVLNWAEKNKEEIEQLKKLEEYRRSFIGNISHELKTPVFNVQGYITTLLDGALEDTKVNRDYLLKAEKNIERMIAIIEDLSAISRLESGEIQLNFTDFDIVSLANEVLDMHEAKAKKRNTHHYLGANSEKPHYVHADKENIRQVLSNLVDNAIKYGKDGGYVKISFYDMDENILIEVADDGIGIAEQHILRLFERFFRVDKGRSREQGGSGLGLAIVKHIVEAHGQTVNARSTQGTGSTFSFTLKKKR